MSDFNAALLAAWPQFIAAFGETVTYTYASGGSASISVAINWDTAQDSASPGYWPSVLLRLSDLAKSPTKGDTLAYGGITYTVFAIHPDGAGCARLELNRNT